MRIPVYLAGECIDRSQTIDGRPANCIGCKRRETPVGKRAQCSVYRSWQVGCKTRALDRADQANVRRV